MSQPLTSLLVHLIFSTKNRVSIITPDVEPDLFAYMGGILKNYESRLLAAGGTSDHVHLLVSERTPSEADIPGGVDSISRGVWD